MADKNPTNREIYTTLGRMEEKLDVIQKQVRITNGRVTVLETWKSNIGYYDSKAGQKEMKEAKEINGWTAREKQLIAIITALLAIVTSLVGAKVL